MSVMSCGRIVSYSLCDADTCPHLSPPLSLAISKMLWRINLKTLENPNFFAATVRGGPVARATHADMGAGCCRLLMGWASSQAKFNASKFKSPAQQNDNFFFFFFHNRYTVNEILLFYLHKNLK